MSITQDTFEALMGLRKRFSDSSELSLGKNWTRDIESVLSKDKFQLDYRSGKIEIRKYSLNHRTRTSVVLVRYCSLKRHTNPDGTVFDGAHIHVFFEGFDDKIALKVEDVLKIDPSLATREEVLAALLKYCNIEEPAIQAVLEA